MNQAWRRRKRQPTTIERYIAWRLNGLRGAQSWQSFANTLGIPKPTIYGAAQREEAGDETITALCRIWRITRIELERMAVDWAEDQAAPFVRGSMTVEK